MSARHAEIRLQQIHDSLSASQNVEPLSVRTFISWFAAERRGYWVARRIREALEAVKLRTVPDFNSVHLDSLISFALVSAPQEARTAPAAADLAIVGETPGVAIPTADTGDTLIAGAIADPAFVVGRLASANSKPLSVSPDCSLGEAVTLMLTHAFSQLPVMTSERDVKGTVSWESIGARLALKKAAATVRECMRPHHEVSSHDSLFTVISQIVEYSYVLVRGEDRTITGIITTADLSLQFQQLSEPFLLLSEIENHVRSLIDGRFTAGELSKAKDSNDPSRTIDSVADLTFGEYIRLLENPANWQKTALTVDRAIFIKELDQIRRIRNDVVHFDPDGITAEDHKLLRQFVQFMHELRAISE